mmetsp:Transcript_152/g.449  ORF Transcript_152/g.449 Transcript_152/m.449 type:complete len:220 (-) Transcript_152:510-1169(-)
MRTVHGVGNGFFTALSTPAARANVRLLSSWSATPSHAANHSTVSAGLRGSTSRLSAVFQSREGCCLMSRSMCFVVFPAAGSPTWRISEHAETGARKAPKYHLPSTSAPPTCTNGSIGKSLAASLTSARSCSFWNAASGVSRASETSSETWETLAPRAVCRAAHRPVSFHCSQSSSMFWSSSPIPISRMRVAPSLCMCLSASLAHWLKLTYCLFPQPITV